MAHTDKPGKGKVFNENTLRNEIIKIWGRYGAHIDVFDELLKKAFPIPSQQEAGQSSQSGMRWVKASERLPEKIVCVRYISDGKMVYATSELWESIEGLDVEWLDESVDETAAQRIKELEDGLQDNNNQEKLFSNILHHKFHSTDTDYENIEYLTSKYYIIKKTK